jgi:hypothetical protein
MPEVENDLGAKARVFVGSSGKTKEVAEKLLNAGGTVEERRFSAA